MARIAFILLCHRDPDGVIAQARRLVSAGDYVAIHYDRAAPPAEFAAIRAALAGEARVIFAGRRLRCGWGEWSLVAATLATLRAALTVFTTASHFYLLSGDCLPIKTAEHARRVLDTIDVDHIETVDFHGGWIRTGLAAERIAFRHWFNERTQPRRFHATLRVQQALGLRRAAPRGLAMRIGSQWWCLRRETVEAVLALVDARPDITRFFRTTWIPDETFFQTLVAHLVPAGEIRGGNPTFLMFTDYGMPVTFHDDHLDLLLGQPQLFARKISPHAATLRARLGALWPERARAFAAAEDGRAAYAWTAARGRVGERTPPPPWDADAVPDRLRVPLVIAAKPWHLGRRLAGLIRAGAIAPTADYVFDEDQASLPDLGGLETDRGARLQHRRATMRLLFHVSGADRQVLCVDPAGADTVRDLAAGWPRLRLLALEGATTDDWLDGHLRRLKLLTDATAPDRAASVAAGMRRTLAAEAARCHAAAPAPVFRLAPDRTPTQNAAALAGFLDVGDAAAHDLVAALRWDD